jgi:hypothetical protein
MFGGIAVIAFRDAIRQGTPVKEIRISKRDLI